MNDHILLQRYLDGRVSHDDLSVLNQRLREDAALREHLRDIAEQACAFGDMARLDHSTADLRALCASLSSNAEVAEKRRGIKMSWLALAASIAVFALGAWFSISSTPHTVLTLLESTGPVSWSHGTAIDPSEKLPAGTLETLGDMSSAMFQFADGSLVTLQGEAEMSFSDEGQKVLKLSRGTLSADIKPQPAGRPMLIHTPSAVAEVVGTAFHLSARADDTLLNVNVGLVKLKRLADGREINVAANRSAVASLHAESELDAGSTPEPLTNWSFDFTQQTPPRDWRGFAKDGRMNAMPYIAKKMSDGSVLTHYGISIRTAMLEQPVRLVATGRSVVRYRLRQGRIGPLHLMLLTHKPDGSFGGNFEVRVDEAELQPSTDGWCEIEVPITRFNPISQRHPSPTGNILTSALIFSTERETQLAISTFSLHTR